MKKIIWFFIGLLILTVALFLSCKKTSLSKTDTLKIVNSKIGGAGGGCPPGSSSCYADCLFTGCFICWDTSYEGGCGCYHGFAQYKTQKKPATEARTTAGINVSKKYIRPGNLNSYFRFLESLKLNPANFRIKFDHFNKTKTEVDKDQLEVDEDEYNDFLEAYKSFIGSLDPGSLSKVDYYIEHH